MRTMFLSQIVSVFSFPAVAGKQVSCTDVREAGCSTGEQMEFEDLLSFLRYRIHLLSRTHTAQLPPAEVHSHAARSSVKRKNQITLHAVI